MIKTSYSSLDIVKFVCALLLVCAHTGSSVVRLDRAVDIVTSLYIIAVPFFFTCSAFLFFSRLKRDGESEKQTAAYKRYIKRIAMMYLLWSVIYFPFVLCGWVRDGVTPQSVLIYFYRSIVFTSYATIWFLPALLVGVSIVYFLQKWFSYEKILMIGVLFYVIGSLGYSYAGIMQKFPLIHYFYAAWNSVFFTVRDGVFNGFPFAALGAYISYSEKRINGMPALVLSGVFACLFIVEAFVLKYTVGFPVGGADTVLFLFPFTYFFFQWLLTIRLKSKNIYLWMRELSLLIFLSQRLFLSAIPSLLPSWVMERVGENATIGMITILGLTFSFSLLLIGLSKKYPILKKMW